MKQIPEKTIERLSLYRRTLIEISDNVEYVYSHDLAQRLHITPVQVRRDLMLIGYTGTLRKGYNVKDLLLHLSVLLDSESITRVCVIGMGNLGRAISGYFNARSAKLKIVASFDTDIDKINKFISGVRCYSMSQLFDIIQNEKIEIGIITTSPESANIACEQLVAAGIKGIMNYTPVRLKVPEHVFLEEYDMITSLEKIAFYIRQLH